MKRFIPTNPFRAPSAKQLALRELEDSERGLLAAHSQAEYASSMVEYHTKQIARLKQYLKSENE